MVVFFDKAKSLLILYSAGNSYSSSEAVTGSGGKRTRTVHYYVDCALSCSFY